MDILNKLSFDLLKCKPDVVWVILNFSNASPPFSPQWHCALCVSPSINLFHQSETKKRKTTSTFDHYRSGEELHVSLIDRLALCVNVWPRADNDSLELIETTTSPWSAMMSSNVQQRFFLFRNAIEDVFFVVVNVLMCNGWKKRCARKKERRCSDTDGISTRGEVEGEGEREEKEERKVLYQHNLLLIVGESNEENMCLVDWRDKCECINTFSRVLLLLLLPSKNDEQKYRRGFLLIDRHKTWGYINNTLSCSLSLSPFVSVWFIFLSIVQKNETFRFQSGTALFVLAWHCPSSAVRTAWRFDFESTVSSRPRPLPLWFESTSLEPNASLLPWSISPNSPFERVRCAFSTILSNCRTSDRVRPTNVHRRTSHIACIPKTKESSRWEEKKRRGGGEEGFTFVVMISSW